MRLQNVFMPGDKPETDAAMCARIEGRYNGNRLYRGCRVRFDTYFGSFSCEKWMKHADTGEIRLILACSGKVSAKICHVVLRDGEVREAAIREVVLESAELKEAEIAIPGLPVEGMIYPVLEALSDEAVVEGGYYVCAREPSRHVHIAMDICTYRRERYVAANLEVLRENFLKNEGDPLHGHLSVFVSDNGRTLDAGAISDGDIRVFPNANAGGSGGFARGMLEVLKSNKPITHVLISDDDIRLDPEMLRRLYAFLRLLKPEQARRTVAGAMFRMDQPHIQHEAAGAWLGQLTDSLNARLDMRDFRNVLQNDLPLKSDYNAWWCSCIPLDVVREQGLPLPFFIRFDDVEYGVRTGGNSISLNGICVWHESFENKYDVSMEYYHARNGQVVNAIHFPGEGTLSRTLRIARLFLMSAIRYRYEAAEHVLEGIADYLKGPEWLMHVDYEKKHAVLRKRNIAMRTVDELGFSITPEQIAEGLTYQPKWRKLLCALTLNGIFVSRKSTAVVQAVQNDMCVSWGRKTIVNMMADGRHCFVSVRDNKKLVQLLGSFFGVTIHYLVRSGSVAKRYRAAFRTMTGANFWETYLRLR